MQQICSTYDVICGTSFIRALSGETKFTTKGTFYLQRFGVGSSTALCVLYSPYCGYSQESAGHAVERALCGAQHDPGSFYAASSLKICSKYRFLVTSEVDATSETGEWCEIKSSMNHDIGNFLHTKNMLQTAVNGSEYIVACMLNKEMTHLQDVKWIHLHSEKSANTDADSSVIRIARSPLIHKGKRVKLILGRVLENELLKIDKIEKAIVNLGSVVKLTFDEDKAPVMALAKKKIEVLPSVIDAH